ncbi:MAG: hypothetical protein GX786_04560 [Clostridiales bacterium]|nr:hypothetical protein [Clostridiales bacterium]
MGSVKEAIDNLPSGVCYFDSRDLLRMCNRQMYHLGFILMGRELQSREELDEALELPDNKRGVTRDGETYVFPDDSAWKIQKKSVPINTGEVYSEYLAFDVSELYRQKQELYQSNAEQQRVMNRLTHIARNVVSIVREEEILSLKMRIHNDLGLALQSTRNFFVHGCPMQDKGKYVADQRKMAKILLVEVGNDDEINVYAELGRIAERLGMKIITTGEIPCNEEKRNLIAMVVRECLTNTIRHAGGNEVYVKITTGKENTITAIITNNGTPPKGDIIEGGGLSSLRDKVEGFGGRIELNSLPDFKMTVILPVKEEAL